MIAAFSAVTMLMLGLPAIAAADVVETTGDGLIPTLRWAGTNRYDTAALIATDGPADAPVFAGDTVVLARGDKVADGLTGSYLAGAVDAPVLLTSPSAVPAATTAALEELAPDTILLLGGEGAIGSEVAEELSTRYAVQRYGGATRYDTAAAIATAGAAAGPVGELDGATTAILATGAVGADALVAGPIAAAEGFPLLLTEPGDLPAATAAALEELGIEHVVIVGGEAAVSADVATGLEGSGLTVQRLSGATRDLTALAVATFARDDLGWTINELAVAGADERSMVDALALGPRAALSSSPIILTGPAGPAAPVRSELAGFGDVAAVTVAGGDAAVSPAAEAAVRTGFALRADQLAAPRSMAVGPDGALYVAENGFGGEDCVGEGQQALCFGPTAGITRIAEGEEPARAYDGLPSAGPGVGVNDVAFDGAAPHVVIGLGVDAATRDAIAADIPLAGDLGTFAEVTDGGLTGAVDLAAFETTNNPDGLSDGGEGDGEGESPLNSNPYGVTRDTTRGVWLVTDAGANALLEITDAGGVSVKAVFPDTATDQGPRQSVPTSVVVGPDGDYYVSELGGEAPGASRVWRVDADTAGEVTPEVYEDGFTFALDLGFGTDGSLYVLQASFDETTGAPGPGTVVRVAPDDSRSELGGGGLTFPLGLQVTDDSVWVSNCGLCPSGEVLQLAIPQ